MQTSRPWKGHLVTVWLLIQDASSAGNMHIGPLKFLTPLHMSVSDSKNTMSIDLWVTSIFQQVGGLQIQNLWIMRVDCAFTVSQAQESGSSLANSYSFLRTEFIWHILLETFSNWDWVKSPLLMFLVLIYQTTPLGHSNLSFSILSCKLLRGRNYVLFIIILNKSWLNEAHNNYWADQ